MSKELAKARWQLLREKMKKDEKLSIQKAVNEYLKMNEGERVDFIKKQIDSGFEELYQALDPNKPMVIFITTHGEAINRSNRFFRYFEKVKRFLTEGLSDSFFASFKEGLSEYLNKTKPVSGEKKRKNDEDTVQVSYIKANVEGVCQYFSSFEAEQMQKYIGKEIIRASTTDVFNDVKNIPIEYINELSKGIKREQFGEHPIALESVKADFFRQLRDNPHISRMIIQGEKWDTFQQDFKPGISVISQVDKQFSIPIGDIHKVKFTDWSIRFFDGYGKTIAMPYMFTLFGHLVGSTISNTNDIVVDFTSILNIAYYLLERRIKEYPDCNQTIIVVDCSCDVKSKTEPFGYGPFLSSTGASTTKRRRVGGAPKTKKRKTKMYQKSKKTKGVSNKKGKSHKYARGHRHTRKN